MRDKTQLRSLAAIALGAIAGALSRYYLDLGIRQVWGEQMPFSLLIINVTGCFAMGFLTPLLQSSVLPIPFKKQFTVHPDHSLLLLTGFLGSYTTFSSYELQGIELLSQNRWQDALIHWVGSVILGFGALQGGIVLAEWLLSQWQRDRSA
jgi:CrcB protein